MPTSRRVRILIHSVSFVSRLKMAKNMTMLIIIKLASVNDNFAGSFVSVIGKKLHWWQLILSWWWSNWSILIKESSRAKVHLEPLFAIIYFSRRTILHGRQTIQSTICGVCFCLHWRWKWHWIISLKPKLSPEPPAIAILILTVAIPRGGPIAIPSSATTVLLK